MKSLKKDHKDFIKKQYIKIKNTSERHNVFTEEINKIALSSNDEKRMQSIDSKETYANQSSKDLVSKKKEIK